MVTIYFTIFYGVYDTRTSELRFASAGHPPPLLFQASGEVEELRCQSVFIGAMPGVNYKEDVVTVRTPARLLVVSDGAYEIRLADGRMWSYEEFKDYVSAQCAPGGPCCAQGPGLEAILDNARALLGRAGFDDDLTMLKVTFLEAPQAG